jgi:hypothetical protein
LIGQWKQIEHCESDQECLTGCTLKQGGQGKILKQRLKEVMEFHGTLQSRWALFSSV